jgi:hypothetical protein
MQHLQGLLVSTYESVMTRLVEMIPLGALVVGDEIMGQLISGIRLVVSPFRKYQLKIFINKGGKVLNLTDARSSSAHQVQIGRVFTLLVVSTHILNIFI